MTFMRVTRDSRGYETTYLMHTPRPGERPRVLYWFRTAPGVRVGRRALDEDAIRTIEEQHPNIEFDWPTLLEESESVPPEVERRPERPRRKPRPQEPSFAESGRPSREFDTGPTTPPNAPIAPAAPSAHGAPGAPIAPSPPSAPSAPSASNAPSVGPKNPLLDQLVGREIASRLRGRYTELATRLHSVGDEEARRRWQARADGLDPDRWATAEAILRGVEHADRLFDELRQELPDERIGPGPIRG